MYRLLKILSKKKISSLFKSSEFDENLSQIIGGIFSCRDSDEREELWSIEVIKKSEYFSSFSWFLLSNGQMPSPLKFSSGEIKGLLESKMLFD